MKVNELVKHGLIAFAMALIVYAAMFSWIQHRRDFKGPWQIAFVTDAEGVPAILVNQPTLQISNQKIVFPGHALPKTNFEQTVIYNGPITNAPFGEVVFQDPTFLPGTITFNFWGHGVELMPRTMVIDQQEIPWHSQTNLVLSGPGKFVRNPVKKPLFE